MPQTNYCRLCVNIISADCKRLYNDNGSINEVYETTAKYFDLMFLDVEQTKLATAICSACWSHITDFNNFQQTILEAQTKLSEEEAKEVEVVVRSDIEFLYDQIPEDCQVPIDITSDEDFNETENAVRAVGTEEQFIALPELQLFYVHDSDSQFNIDDESGATESNESVNEENTMTGMDNGLNADAGVMGENINKPATQQKSKDGPIINNSIESDKKQGDGSEGTFSEVCENVAITNNNETNMPAFIDQDDGGNTLNPYQCKLCQKIFTRMSSVKRHMYIHETANGRTRGIWSCDLCNVQLKSRHGLQYHKEVAHHDGTTVCVCNVCGKIAATAVHLRRHYKSVHQPKRRHLCTLCCKDFKHPLGLREHMATHTGRDLYKCAHCTMTFKCNSTLHRHRKKTHPEEWAEGRKYRRNLTKIYLNQISHQTGSSISEFKCS